MSVLTKEELQKVLADSVEEALQRYDKMLTTKLDAALEAKLQPLASQMSSLATSNAQHAKRLDSIEQNQAAIAGKINELVQYAKQTTADGKKNWHGPLRGLAFNMQNAVVIFGPPSSASGKAKFDLDSVTAIIKATLSPQEFNDAFIQELSSTMFKVTMVCRNPIHGRKAAAKLLKCKKFGEELGGRQKHDRPEELRKYQSMVLSRLWKAKNDAGLTQKKCYFSRGLAYVGDTPLFPEFMSPTLEPFVSNFYTQLSYKLQGNANIDVSILRPAQNDNGIFYFDAVAACAVEKGAPSPLSLTFGGGGTSYQASVFRPCGQNGGLRAFAPSGGFSRIDSGGDEELMDTLGAAAGT